MAEDNKQVKKEEASSKATSVPLNKTPPAPPEKTNAGIYCRGSVKDIVVVSDKAIVFVQNKGNSSGNKENPSDNKDNPSDNKDNQE